MRDESVCCARGQMENLIKDMKPYMRSDKAACHRGESKQFRLFLHKGFCGLLHSVRQSAPRSRRSAAHS